MAVLTIWVRRLGCSTAPPRCFKQRSFSTSLRSRRNAENPCAALARETVDRLLPSADLALVDGLSRSLAHYASRLYNATDLNEMSRTVTSDLSLDDSLDETTMAVAKEYANERTTDHHCAETIAGVLLLHLSTKMQLKAAQDVHDQAASAAFGLATLLVQWNNDNHLKEASKLYQSLARFGHGLSLYQLALMSISGRGLTQDYDRAHKLLDQAIRQGAVDAYNTLGVLHKNGWGTEPSDELARHYFELGATQDEAFASLSLGVMLMESSDPIEQLRALELLFSAADKGLVSALYYLSVCYRHGLGVDQDLEHADGLLKEAAEQGHELAKVELAIP